MRTPARAFVRVSENERVPFSIALAYGVRPTDDRRVRDVAVFQIEQMP